MSYQRLTGLRKRLYYNRLTESAKEQMMQRLCERIKKLKNPSSSGVISTRPISTHRAKDGEIDTFPKPVYLDVPDIKCVRKGFIIPAVVRDHHGKFFQETTLIKVMSKRECMSDLNLDRVVNMMKTGAFPSKDVVREVIRRVGWNMYEERYDMPSLWQVVTAEEPELYEVDSQGGVVSCD
jgi:hypothetical protein